MTKPPNSLARDSVESLHEQALFALTEVEEENGQIYSVAVSARAFIGDDDPIAGNMFGVIERIREDARLVNELRKLIQELAMRAKSTHTPKKPMPVREVAHG